MPPLRWIPPARPMPPRRPMPPPVKPAPLRATPVTIPVSHPSISPWADPPTTAAPNLLRCVEPRGTSAQDQERVDARVWDTRRRGLVILRLLVISAGLVELVLRVGGRLLVDSHAARLDVRSRVVLALHL